MTCQTSYISARQARLAPLRWVRTGRGGCCAGAVPTLPPQHRADFLDVGWGYGPGSGLCCLLVLLPRWLWMVLLLPLLFVHACLAGSGVQVVRPWAYDQGRTLAVFSCCCRHHCGCCYSLLGLLHHRCCPGGMSGPSVHPSANQAAGISRSATVALGTNFKGPRSSCLLLLLLLLLLLPLPLPPLP